MAKKSGLKPHHKIILMSAFGLGALGISFLGGIKAASQSAYPCRGDDKPCITGYPSIYPTYPPRPDYKSLDCNSCPSIAGTKTLCFSQSKKRAWCKNPQLGADPGYSICVTCSNPSPTPAPTCIPLPPCLTHPPYCYGATKNMPVGTRFCPPSPYPTRIYPSGYPTIHPGFSNNNQ